MRLIRNVQISNTCGAKESGQGWRREGAGKQSRRYSGRDAVAVVRRVEN